MLTQEYLKSILHYDPETGVFTWLHRHDVDGRTNGRYAGNIAGSPSIGYISIGINGRRYQAHRLAFLYMVGRWPNPECDHQDTNRENNRWANLRESTSSQNKANTSKRSHSRQLLKGTRERTSSSWQAYISINKKRAHLGTFDCPAAAHFAYLIAADQNFGKFARAA